VITHQDTEREEFLLVFPIPDAGGAVPYPKSEYIRSTGGQARNPQFFPFRVFRSELCPPRQNLFRERAQQAKPLQEFLCALCGKFLWAHAASKPDGGNGRMMRDLGSALIYSRFRLGVLSSHGSRFTSSSVHISRSGPAERISHWSAERTWMNRGVPHRSWSRPSESKTGWSSGRKC